MVTVCLDVYSPVPAKPHFSALTESVLTRVTRFHRISFQRIQISKRENSTDQYFYKKKQMLEKGYC